MIVIDGPDMTQHLKMKLLGASPNNPPSKKLNKCYEPI